MDQYIDVLIADRPTREALLEMAKGGGGGGTGGGYDAVIRWKRDLQTQTDTKELISGDYAAVMAMIAAGDCPNVLYYEWGIMGAISMMEPEVISRILDASALGETGIAIKPLNKTYYLIWAEDGTITNIADPENS